MPAYYAVVLLFAMMPVYVAHAQQAGYRDNFDSITTSGSETCNDTWCHKDITPNAISPEKYKPMDDHFDTIWLTSHMSAENGVMTLTLDDCADNKEECGEWPYGSAEYQSKEYYGHGCFSGRMKAAKEPGVFSSLFTYNWNPWDEIDIEFPGNDTTVIQTGYFVNGSNTDTNEGDSTVKIYPLGFDAADDFHVYQIDWQADYIAWFVDGEEIRRVTSDAGPLPLTNMQLMANLWTGKGIEQWVGELNYSTPVTAEYDWIEYRPEPCTATPLSEDGDDASPVENSCPRCHGD